MQQGDGCLALLQDNGYFLTKHKTMIKQLTKLSRLHKNEWRTIKNLIDYSANQDKFRIKAYWHVLQDRLTNEFNDFLYLLDGNLIGYLGLFTFTSNEAEMTAVIHPKFRQKHLFRKLLSEALLELRQRRIEYCTWIIPQRSVLTRDFAEQLGGQYLFSQTEMKAVRSPIARELPEIRLDLATMDHVSTLADLGATSFKASYADTLQRLTENLREKNRKAWLLSTPEHTHVGKIHVRYEDANTAFIHDLCIAPEHRGKNLAMAMNLKTMDILRAQGYSNIILDVELHNEGALKLYENCGFEAQHAYDFCRIETHAMQQRWGS